MRHLQRNIGRAMAVINLATLALAGLAGIRVAGISYTEHPNLQLLYILAYLTPSMLFAVCFLWLLMWLGAFAIIGECVWVGIELNDVGMVFRNGWFQLLGLYLLISAGFRTYLIFGPHLTIIPK